MAAKLIEYSLQNIDDIVKHIATIGRGKRLIVFVCGFGGAGKTTFCRQLAAAVTCPAIVFETDWYAKYATTERRERIKSALVLQDDDLIRQEENPKNWYDWPALVAGLGELKNSGRLKIRHGWCQKSGEKVLSKDLELPDSSESLVICDGIYLLHEEVKSSADLILLLDTSVETAIERTALRDQHRSSKEYLDYKAALVEQYDIPYFRQNSKNADAVISSKLFENQ